MAGRAAIGMLVVDIEIPPVRGIVRHHADSNPRPGVVVWVRPSTRSDMTIVAIHGKPILSGCRKSILGAVSRTVSGDNSPHHRPAPAPPSTIASMTCAGVKVGLRCHTRCGEARHDGGRVRGACQCGAASSSVPLASSGSVTAKLGAASTGRAPGREFGSGRSRPSSPAHRVQPAVASRRSTSRSLLPSGRKDRTFTRIRAAGRIAGGRDDEHVGLAGHPLQRHP